MSTATATFNRTEMPEEIQNLLIVVKNALAENPHGIYFVDVCKQAIETANSLELTREMRNEFGRIMMEIVGANQDISVFTKEAVQHDLLWKLDIEKEILDQARQKGERVLTRSAILA